MLVEQSVADYTDFRIPGIIATEKGTLLRYCECRKSASDWADIDIKVSRSEDEGHSWETVLLIEGRGNTLNNPVMFVDKDQLVFLYCKNYKEIWKRVSTDDGQSFGNAERVNFENGVDFFFNVVAVGPGHGIVHGGKLIVPIWFAYSKEDPKSHRPSFIATLYSEDAGKNWSVGETIFKDELINPSECALAVTAENEILISIRHEGKKRTRALAKSVDGICGWREFRFEEKLCDPICMGSMAHRGGAIYHINCDSESKRKYLTVKISRDCFESCQNILVSDNAGYSDIALLGDKICVFFEKANAGGALELHFETIPVPKSTSPQ